MSVGERIFLSSQSFGFGPSAELIRISKGFKRADTLKLVELYVYDTPEVKTILDQTKSGMRRISGEEDGCDVLEFLLQYGREYGFDRIFSSYDAAPIFYGWFHNIPCYLYDGMLSFWDVGSFKESIDNNLKILEETKEQQDEDKMVRLYREITANNHHESIFLAYFLANRNFARGGDNPFRKLKDFLQLQRKTKIVGGIMDPDMPYDPKIEREHILVSLSASLVPTVSFEQNMAFAINTLNFVVQNCGRFGSIPWIMSMNPKIIEALRKAGYLANLPCNLEVRKSFNTEENIDHIRRARVLLISPGYSSIHEAAYYRTPTIFLPEQNGGQPVGYTKLKNDGFPILANLTCAENIGGKRTTDFDEFHAEDLYSETDRIYGSPEFAAVRDGVRELIAEILNDKQFAFSLGKEQSSSIARIIGGFEGVSQIVEGICST